MFLYESPFMQDMWGSLEIATAPSCYVRIGELLNNEILDHLLDGRGQKVTLKRCNSMRRLSRDEVNAYDSTIWASTLESDLVENYGD